MNEFGCVVPFISQISEEKRGICVNKTKDEMKAILQSFEKSVKKSRNETCILPCSSADVYFGVLFHDSIREDGKSKINIYFKSSVDVQQTIYDYTFLSFLAEIGGYTGLLLGASVVNFNGILDKVKEIIIN